MLTKSQLIIIGIVAFVIVVFVLIFNGIIPGLQQEGAKTGGQVVKSPPKIPLEFWGVYDNQESYKTAFSAFGAANPGVEFNYKKFDNEKEYFNAILEALATGEGPDIMMIPSNGLTKHISRLQPAPAQVNINFLRQSFPQVVEQDFVAQGNVYALPLSIDTLVLFYNRDLLDQAAINPPTTWEDFKKITIQITKLTAGKTIASPGAAIGGSSKSVHNAPDILMMLMAQNGTTMTNNQGGPAFASAQGENALKFYTQFSDTTGDSYVWNDQLQYSLDAFAQEKVPFIIDYASAIPEIKARNQFLNFAAAPAPQSKEAQKTVSYSHYWGYTVPKQSKKQDLAWRFIANLATQQAGAYMTATKKPPALRELINQNLNDIGLGIFAKQALTARSWAQPDPEAVKTIFDQMIVSVLENKVSITNALGQAQTQVSALRK